MSKFFIFAVVIAIFIIFMMRHNTNKAEAQKNLSVGTAFLASNSSEIGVVATPSGLQYKVLNQGEGQIKPLASSKVKVHYHGTLLDGTVFDSSVDRGQPISFALKQVISGWTEGLQLMVVGDKYRFYIPASLAYGNRATGKIAAGSLLIFDVELLAIN
jgi:peptidylprolyl isomerase